MINAEQLEIRKRYIGSSDAAAVMGLDPYRSAADVWAEKTGHADGFGGNDATDAGTLLEPAILNWAHGQLGNMHRDVLIVHDNGLTCANLDGILVGGKAIVEAKSTGIVGPPDPAYGEPGTDEVPDRVLIQCLHQLAHVPTAQVVWVPVLIGGRGWQMYRVPRVEDLVISIQQRTCEFMERFVRTLIRPDEFRPSLETLKRWRREPNKTADISRQLVDDLIVAKAVKAKSCEECEEVEKALLLALGDAEAGITPDGQVVTYLETHRKGYTVEPTTYRSLRIKGMAKKKQLAAAVAARGQA